MPTEPQPPPDRTDSGDSGAAADSPTDLETGAPEADPAAAARDALARARKAARDKGFRPGMKPNPRLRAGSASSSGAGGRTRAGQDARDPALLGEQLGRLLSDRGWEPDVQVGSVMGRWAEIVGPDIAAHATPVGFEGSVLTVRADSTAWASELRLLSSNLIGRIEQIAGAGVVTELVVHGPAGPSWVKGRRRVAGPGPRDTYG